VTVAPARQILDFHAQAGAMTSPGRQARSFDGLPRDVAALARIVQGLMVHEFMADAYGWAIPEERRSECQIRSIERLLERLLALDPRPLTVARPVDKRLVGICAHFTVFLVALLRAQGVPARARYGFGAYFNPPCFEEHVVCEYWNAAAARWMLVDTQFDEVWRRKLAIDHDVLDVPRDRFLIAGDAWARCRAGAADPAKFGIFVGDLRGLWFIAGELVRDVAALNKMEMLPWEVWGAQPRPGATLDPKQLQFFDELAALTRVADTSFGELRSRYEDDDQLRVPGTVFNARLNRATPP
jgi:hypothetical protein